MEAVAFDKKDEMPQENLGEVRKVTIFLSSLNKKDVVRCSREFYEFVSTLMPHVQLPYILPVSEAVYTVRKSPCGNGTATFSRFRLRIHQRKFDLELFDSHVSTIIEFLKNSPVDAQLKMNF